MQQPLSACACPTRGPGSKSVEIYCSVLYATSTPWFELPEGPCHGRKKGGVIQDSSARRLRRCTQHDNHKLLVGIDVNVLTEYPASFEGCSASTISLLGNSNCPCRKFNCPRSDDLARWAKVQCDVFELLDMMIKGQVK